MEERMSRWGTGLIFAALSVGYGLLTIVISRYFHPSFQIGFASHWFLTILGIALIVIGIPFFIVLEVRGTLVQKVIDIQHAR
jgi:mannose/fructose/N-acetylgalactosamine-specific phosphotransferase system component IIC